MHAVTKEIEDIIKSNNFWYETFVHEPARTSKEAARIRPDYNLSQGTKALIVRATISRQKQFVMVVVPGNRQFDTKKLKEVFSLSHIRFATLEEVLAITNGIVPGGVPPFGNLFKLPIYADVNVFKNQKIIFSAGDQSISIALYANDYKTLVEPNIGDISGAPTE